MVAKGEWSDYEKGKKKEYGEFVRKAREFVYARESPWQANPDNMGQPAKNDPRALVICLLLKTWLRLPYRDLVSFLGNSNYLWPLIGLRKLPGRMDLQRAMTCLTKEYLSELNTFIVEEGYYGKKGEEITEKKNGAPVLLIVPAFR
jgi:hypothetical protein